MVRRSGLLLAFWVVAACSDDPATPRFVLPEGAATEETFYDLPFPNDLRRTDTGVLELSAFPSNALLLDQIRTASTQLDGFSLNGAMFAKFDGQLDPASLPDPAASMEESASVYLVNVDADSPERGARTPIITTFITDGALTIGHDYLVARPYPGFPLDEGTTYALVITTRVKSADGSSINRASVFSSLAAPAYDPLFAYLDESGGDDRDDVASAAVFTTQHATTVAQALRKGVMAAPAPVATDIMLHTSIASMTVFTGNYMAPNFQQGDPPYKNTPAGEIKVGADGVAIQVRMEPLRFSLSVPVGPVPATGFPIAIYSHGTGGDYFSGIADGTAERLALEGVATISMDQVLHGPRNPGGNPELDFFNIGNVFAARDNPLQGAADAFSQMRLANSLSFDDMGRTIKLDMNRLFFFGHSQGGLTGPGFVAFEPSLKGAVLSGTGGLLYLSLLNKTDPVNFPALAEALLRDEPVDENNPSMALVQMWVDRSDPVNFAPLMVRKPAPGIQPRAIFQTEGFTDTYTPNVCIEAFATAIGGDIVQEPDAKELLGLTLRGREIKPAPITGNLNGTTAALAQYKQRAGSNGHFVVFDISAARQQSAKFLGTLASTGKATVVPAN